MADLSQARKTASNLIFLRAALMLLAGLYAVIFPLQALAVLVIAGGILFLIDGVLGLWGLTFGGVKTGNYWFDVIRNVLSILAGLVILLSPYFATILTTVFVVYVVALQAIIVGVMEIVVITRERQLYARIWPVVLNGAIYILFGLALLFAPLMSAQLLVMFGGVLMILFAIGLFMLGTRLRNGGSPATAAGSASRL